MELSHLRVLESSSIETLQVLREEYLKRINHIDELIKLLEYSDEQVLPPSEHDEFLIDMIKSFVDILVGKAMFTDKEVAESILKVACECSKDTTIPPSIVDTLRHINNLYCDVVEAPYKHIDDQLLISIIDGIRPLRLSGVSLEDAVKIIETKLEQSTIWTGLIDASWTKTASVKVVADSELPLDLRDELISMANLFNDILHTNHNALGKNKLTIGDVIKLVDKALSESNDLIVTDVEVAEQLMTIDKIYCCHYSKSETPTPIGLLYTIITGLGFSMKNTSSEIGIEYIIDVLKDRVICVDDRVIDIVDTSWTIPQAFKTVYGNNAVPHKKDLENVIKLLYSTMSIDDNVPTVERILSIRASSPKLGAITAELDILLSLIKRNLDQHDLSVGISDLSVILRQLTSDLKLTNHPVVIFELMGRLNQNLINK